MAVILFSVIHLQPTPDHVSRELHEATTMSDRDCLGQYTVDGMQHLSTGKSLREL